jgi:hypothetical protein
MKTKAIVATLLVAAAASADARFAWPYPRKAVSPDESGHWIVITSNSWPYSAESELTTASPSGGGPDAQKSSPAKKEKTQLKTGMFHSGLRHELPSAWRSDSSLQTVPRR